MRRRRAGAVDTGAPSCDQSDDARVTGSSVVRPASLDRTPDTVA